MPSLPSLKSPPSGITDHTRNAGTKARNGASRYTHRSARSGMKSSLKISFMPSASVCRSPNGPALFGPTRFCMPAMILRSNQTMNIVPTRPMTKITSDLEQDDARAASTAAPPSSSGSMPAAHVTQTRSTRTSMAGAVASTMSVIDARRRR